MRLSDSEASNMPTRVCMLILSPIWNSMELGSESACSSGLQIIMQRFSKYILCI